MVAVMEGIDRLEKIVCEPVTQEAILVQRLTWDAPGADPEEG